MLTHECRWAKNASASKSYSDGGFVVRPRRGPLPGTSIVVNSILVPVQILDGRWIFDEHRPVGAASGPGRLLSNLGGARVATKQLYAAAIEQTGVVPSMYGAVHLWMVALTVIL